MITTLEKMIAKSRQRLSESPYKPQDVFRPEHYDWPGDWEGRAILAFACHTMIGEEFPSLRKTLTVLPHKTGKKGYFGAPFDTDSINEQQLSGHNWLLRGLLQADEIGCVGARDEADRLVENLYLPALQHYGEYPTAPREEAGGVSGTNGLRVRNWQLSTDVGCAFVPLDGICEYYKLSKKSELKPLIEKAIERFATLDFVGLKMQTHATLSALRGVLTFYEATEQEQYLALVKKIFDLYINKGMTLTYENYNWFGRENTWTEPCAVVDSFILAVRLYKITQEELYRTLARRIGFNGLMFCQRENGGAGPNTCVTEEQPYLSVHLYEAEFCCTMRYAEGLKWLWENREMFEEETDKVTKQDGRYFCGDRLLVQDVDGVFAECKQIDAYGKRLITIPSLTDKDKTIAERARLKVYFDD